MFSFMLRCMLLIKGEFASTSLFYLKVIYMPHPFCVIHSFVPNIHCMKNGWLPW